MYLRFSAKSDKGTLLVRNAVSDAARHPGSGKHRFRETKMKKMLCSALPVTQQQHKADRGMPGAGSWREVRVH